MGFVIIQGIGGLGLLCFVLSYQAKSNRVLFFCQMMGCALFALQFALLSAYSGCALLLVNMARNALLLEYHHWSWVRTRWTAISFAVLSTILVGCTWDGWRSLLPFAGILATTFAYWSDNPLKIRLSQLFINSPATLLYDILVSSWTGVLNESITLVSIIISIFRYGWKELSSRQNKF